MLTELTTVNLARAGILNTRGWLEVMDLKGLSDEFGVFHQVVIICSSNTDLLPRFKFCQLHTALVVTLLSISLMCSN